MLYGNAGTFFIIWNIGTDGDNLSGLLRVYTKIIYYFCKK